MGIWKVEGCSTESRAHGMCNLHYQRFTKYGDTGIDCLSKNPNGSGGLQKGYFTITVDGKRIKNSVYVSEKVLGHKLPTKAVVHHIDGNKSNDSKSNLIICQDNAYHFLLHQRAKALKACGHASWYRCHVCKEYGPIGEIERTKDGSSYHPECEKKRNRERGMLKRKGAK